MQILTPFSANRKPPIRILRHKFISVSLSLSLWKLRNLLSHFVWSRSRSPSFWYYAYNPVASVLHVSTYYKYVYPISMKAFSSSYWLGFGILGANGRCTATCRPPLPARKRWSVKNDECIDDAFLWSSSSMWMSTDGRKMEAIHAFRLRGEPFVESSTLQVLHCSCFSPQEPRGVGPGSAKCSASTVFVLNFS